jgi:hypothetical protein
MSPVVTDEYWHAREHSPVRLVVAWHMSYGSPGIRDELLSCGHLGNAARVARRDVTMILNTARWRRCLSCYFDRGRPCG